MAVGGLVQSVYSLAIHNTTREPERYLITEYSRLKFKIAPVKIYSAAGSGMGKPEKEEVRHDNAIQRHVATVTVGSIGDGVRPLFIF